MHFFAHLADFESMLLAPMEAVLCDARKLLEMEIDIDRLEGTVGEAANAVELIGSQGNSSPLGKGGRRQLNAETAIADGGNLSDESQTVGYGAHASQEKPAVGYAVSTSHENPTVEHAVRPSHENPTVRYAVRTSQESPAVGHAVRPSHENPTVGYAAHASHESPALGYAVRTIQIPAGTPKIPLMDAVGLRLPVNPPLAPVLIPLRTNQVKTSVVPYGISPLSQASLLDGEGVNAAILSPSETQATASRLTVAMEPSFEQAYQLTQAQLEKSHLVIQEQPSTSLVRNTFNVTVVMNGKQSPEDIDRTVLEEALTDILRASARRHGLEV